MTRALVTLAAIALLAAAKPQKHQGPAGWVIDTSDAVANMQTGAFSAPSHVRMTRADGSTVDADRAEGNFKRKQSDLYGNVVLHDATGAFGGAVQAANAPRGPATLRCDHLSVDQKTKRYVALGNVHYEQNDATAQAARAVLNDVSHRLVFSGDVHLARGDRTLDAQTVTYDTVTGDSEADTGVRMTFPNTAHVTIATPKPIIIHR